MCRVGLFYHDHARLIRWNLHGIAGPELLDANPLRLREGVRVKSLHVMCNVLDRASLQLNPGSRATRGLPLFWRMLSLAAEATSGEAQKG